jgi:molybdate transport system regulatory protein
MTEYKLSWHADNRILKVARPIAIWGKERISSCQKFRGNLIPFAGPSIAGTINPRPILGNEWKAPVAKCPCQSNGQGGNCIQLMKENNAKEDSLSLPLRMQVVGKREIVLGPGKIELLSLLAETGSIGEAARRMKMSYMKAWTLIQTMKPLVATVRGGRKGGGAEVTDTGRQAIELYKKMQHDCRRVCEPSWKKLRQVLRAED